MSYRVQGFRMTESEFDRIIGGTAHISSVPDDATIDGVWTEDGEQYVVVAFTHISFDAVPEGKEMPIEVPTITDQNT